MPAELPAFVQALCAMNRLAVRGVMVIPAANQSPEATLASFHRAADCLRALQQQGYPVEGLPHDGTTLIHQLLGGVTNDLDNLDLRPCAQSLALNDYQRWFASLPAANQRAVTERWGPPEQDPMYRSGRLMVAGLRFGLTFVGIQPARGYQLDPAAVYHVPDLVPPHGYIAGFSPSPEPLRAGASMESRAAATSTSPSTGPKGWSLAKASTKAIR